MERENPLAQKVRMREGGSVGHRTEGTEGTGAGSRRQEGAEEREDRRTEDTWLRSPLVPLTLLNSPPGLALTLRSPAPLVHRLPAGVRNPMLGVGKGKEPKVEV